MNLVLHDPVIVLPTAGRSMDQAAEVSSRVATQRLPAPYMDLYQTMESVCTLLHRAAGVRMCLLYVQCISCCWSLSPLAKSGSLMAVC
jgi:hypothetical protein